MILFEFLVITMRWDAIPFLLIDTDLSIQRIILITCLESRVVVSILFRFAISTWNETTDNVVVLYDYKLS